MFSHSFLVEFFSDQEVERGFFFSIFYYLLYNLYNVLEGKMKCGSGGGAKYAEKLEAGSSA